jgi:phage shock protein E
MSFFYVKIGLAVVLMGILANLLFRSGADKDVDIPALVRAGALIIDTRTAGEFSRGHIDGAVNIPYDRISSGIKACESDPSRSIVVYCHSGARSGVARKALQQAGYTHVVNGGSLRHMQTIVRP